MSTDYHTILPNGFPLNASEWNSRFATLDAAIGSIAATTGLNSICDGRLTLTTSTPVTTADVTAATTLRWSAYGGNRVALYNGATWDMITFASDRTVAVPATTDTNYDVYIYNNAGTATLELTAWSTSTAGGGSRATALTTQDGVLVKSGTPTRRYLGMMRTTGVSGQTEDSVTKRLVWNYYHRSPRRLYVFEDDTSWSYTSAVWRSLNNATTNRVEFVCGFSEDPVYFTHHFVVTGATGFGGIALNATNTSDAHGKAWSAGSAFGVSVYEDEITANYHFLQLTEYGAASALFYGDNNAPTILQTCGIGWILG
jgi:hypothetical protein